MSERFESESAAKRIVLSTETDGPWCHLCPLWDGHFAACQAEQRRPTYERSERDADAGSPAWCPLRAGDVVVTLAAMTTGPVGDPPGSTV